VPATVTGTITSHGGAHAQARLHRIIGRLLAAHRSERNRLLFWASLRAGEMVADEDLDARAAVQALTGAATQIGLVGEDGPRAVAATIRSGFQRAGGVYPPDHAPEITGRSKNTPPQKPLVRCSATVLGSCREHRRTVLVPPAT
jgi:hypothetical protein